MDWSLLAPIVLLVGALPLAWVGLSRRRWRRGWASAARALGLELLLEGAGVRLRGVLGGVRVHLEGERGRSGWCCLASPEAQPLVAGLRVWPRRSEASDPDTGEICTGDPVFDDRFEVRGAHLTTLAALTASVRGRLLAPPGGGRVTVDEDGVRYVGTALSNRVPVTRWLGTLAADLGLAPAGVSGRLAQSVVSDPQPRVRAACLQALAEWARMGEATEALDRALDRALAHGAADRDPRVRLVAARHQGEPGLQVAIRLLDDPETPLELRAAAVSMVAEHFPTARSWPVLRSALHHKRPAVRRAAVEALLHLEPAFLRRHGLALIEHADALDSEIAAGLLQIIGRLGPPLPEGVEAALLERLEGTPVRVALAAAEALALVGGAAAFRRAETLWRLPHVPDPLRRALRSAARRIRDRL